MSNTSIAAPGICLFFNALIKACSSTIGPRDALINRAVGFILASSAAPTKPRVRLLNTQDIGPLEQLVLGNQDCARGFGGLGRHVLAPGNQIHSKIASDPCDLGSNPPESQNAQNLS